MRKIKRYWRYGETRSNEGFLLIPTSANEFIDGEEYTITRWFEHAKWEEKCYYDSYGQEYWKITRWLDLDD